MSVTLVRLKMVLMWTRFVLFVLSLFIFWYSKNRTKVLHWEKHFLSCLSHYASPDLFISGRKEIKVSETWCSFRNEL